MEFNSEPIGRYVRIISIITLLLGLNDAGRLLGVTLGAQSPIAAYGMVGFVDLAVFTLALLFAAVGLWIKASWGGVLLAGATGTELAMFLLGSKDVQITVLGFGVRLVLLAAVLAIFVLGFRMRRAAAAHD
ncbi:MAG: DUF6163 family protein [Devosia sp.]|nr:DUF6163 family protein [Devosia sp.]